MSGRRLSGLMLFVVAVGAPPPPSRATAQEGFAALCALLTHQAQVQLEDLELAVETDATRLAVDERIFGLLDELWENELIERLIYKAVKHRRDSSAISLRTSRYRAERQQAVLEQHHVACSTADHDDGTEHGALEQLQRDYDAAECAIRGLEVEQFQVDLEYQDEVLVSAQNLRQSDIASVQQLLTAQRDVDLTAQRLELATRRAAQCGAGPAV